MNKGLSIVRGPAGAAGLIYFEQKRGEKREKGQWLGSLITGRKKTYEYTMTLPRLRALTGWGGKKKKE